ncbi:unconventional prefoldin RPB5 interactor-like [Asterias rubens]|uniref:unconventional prefoldin RPB5 interactor-like n=1 Tax=Asterias rubens TaxID=7604 RepID=UPI001455790C|nr:unconventional prefoldin RPB5 interactor-like [Asterias rubens]
MDPAHVSRLKEEIERCLDETESKTKKWEKFKDDYTALQDRLRSLPDKVSHNIMVPFGSVAFMPGQIVHTNEIMVLLGDNWFCERSAKQACEIVDRRKENVDSMLSDLAKQSDLLKSRLGFTSELKDMSDNKGDLVDIREDYDAEKEARWREERKAKKKTAASGVTKSKSSESHQGDMGQGSNQPLIGGRGQAITSHNSEGGAKTREEGEGDRGRVEEGDQADATGRRMTELWARLDELERQEEELDELARQDENTVPSKNPNNSQSGDDTGRHVRWEDDEYEESDSDDDTADPKPTTITFRHTKAVTDTETPVAKESPSACAPSEISTTLLSPADIYKQYLTTMGQNPGGGTSLEEAAPCDETHGKGQLLKSILKSGPRSHLVRAPEEPEGMQKKEAKNHVILPAPPSAFSGQVTEREETRVVPEVVNLPPTSSEPPAPPKKVSRFKAARQNQQLR